MVEERELARAKLWEVEEGRRRAQLEADIKDGEAKALDRLKSAEEQSIEMIRRAEEDARAKVSQLLDKSRLDAAETIAKEAQISRSASALAVSLYRMGNLVFSYENVPKISALVATALQGGAMSPEKAAQVLNHLSRFALHAEQIGILAIKTERARVGAPTEVFKVDLEGATLEEAQSRLGALQRAIERAVEEKSEQQKLNGSSDSGTTLQ